jgi:hypothetical protein
MTAWRVIPGYEGSYEASDDGQIRSVERYVRIGRGEGHLRHYPARIRSLHTDKGGYKRVTLKVAGVARSHLVHHLVLESFVGPKPDGMECLHGNDIPDDNRLANLKWGTSSENSYDIVRHGNHHNANKTHCVNGHEFTPENTIPNGEGRGCRTCNRERAAKWYEEHKGPVQPHNKDKTHCKRGHEFTPENTHLKPSGRECRTCMKAYHKARYEAKKAKQT